jgi:uncharacterized repeat protein (TIGR03943 family)
VTTRNETTLSSFDSFSQDLSRFELADWVSFFASNPRSEQVAGTSATVTGFFYTDTNGNYYVGRFRINCCAVDATPLGIQLSKDSVTEKLEQGSWYKISGVFAADKVDNSTIFRLQVEKVEKTTEPEFPYVY